MNTNIEKFYNKKDNIYFSNIRYDIIEKIKGENLNILEVGCGSGETLLELKRLGKAKEIVGIEICENSIGKNKELLDGVIIGNIEDIDIDYPSNYFDIIILADVLEHLINPEEVLDKVSKYLNNSGYIIASVPNIREFKTLFKIFFMGNFEYSKEGILDETHLRFFCKKNILRLVKRYFKVTKIEMSTSYRKRFLLNKLTLGIFEGFLCVQYIIVAKNNCAK